MKARIEIFFFSIIFVAISYAQGKIDTSKVESRRLNCIKYLQPSYNEVGFYDKLYFSDTQVIINENPNTIWLWTSISLSNQNSSNSRFQKNSYQILSPLVQLYLDKSKINPMEYILGLVQTGVVGYMAFQHIKKYGFLK